MEHMQGQKLLHKKYLVQIIMKVRDEYAKEDSLVDIEVPAEEEITVCGDVHGQYYDMLNIFKLNGNPAPLNPYLFNGDVVDRGSFSVECILAMLAWKVALPKSMFITRGNHESQNMNKLYGFEGEVTKKYDKMTMELFTDLFRKLPLAYLINKRVTFAH